MIVSPNSAAHTQKTQPIRNHFVESTKFLQWPVERYLSARNSLIEHDLIAFDGTRFQVLELPDTPPAPRAALTDEASLEDHDPATIRALIRGSLGTDV